MTAVVVALAVVVAMAVFSPLSAEEVVESYNAGMPMLSADKVAISTDAGVPEFSAEEISVTPMVLVPNALLGGLVWGIRHCIAQTHGLCFRLLL